MAPSGDDHCAPTYAVAAVRCPWPGCGERIPVPVRVEIRNDPDGSQRITADPEVDDVWAHYFTHRSGGHH